jgi:peptidoglycan-associated lipoprotein
MKLRFLTLVAAVALLAACADDTANTGAAKTTATQPTQQSTQKTTTTGPAKGSQEDFVANTGDRVFFAFDKSDLSSEAKGQLGKWVAFLKQYPQDSLTIEGHADERGTREYNLALGERRANSVKSFLVANGVQATRLKTISYGKERPAVIGSNDAAWAQNRRGVGVVTQ